MEHYYTGEMDYTGVGLDRFYCLYQFEELMGFTWLKPATINNNPLGMRKTISLDFEEDKALEGQ